MVVFSLSTQCALRSQDLHRDLFKLDAELFRDDLSSRQNRDVLEDLLSPIPEPWCLYCAGAQNSADLIDDKGRKSIPSTSSAMIKSMRPI